MPAPSRPVPSTHPSRAAAARAAASAARSGPQPPESGGSHLAVAGVSKSYADRRVLSGVSFTARAGDRLGLIGENGTGKSTLLRILGGSEEPDAGAVTHAGGVGSLAQQLPFPDETPLGAVLDDAQRGALDAREAIEAAGEAFASDPGAPGAADAYAAALEAAERSGAWRAEARRGEVVAGLGLGGIPAVRPVGELSGGQRLRLALAALLLEAPHTLLLDEPSNHLDDAAAAYLERVLGEWPGIVIFASHDRALLDAVATRIVDLDPAPAQPLQQRTALRGDGAEATPGSGRRPQAGGPIPDLDEDDPGAGIGVRVWGTGYSAAREAQRAELARWRERYAVEQRELAALVHEIEVGSREVNRKHESKSESRITRKFYADKDARVVSRRARNARVRLAQLERERVRRPPEPLRFAGIGGAPGEAGEAADPALGRAAGPGPGRAVADPRAAAAPLLRAEGLARAGRLAPVSLAVGAGGRLMLAGPNGAGKSTLLEMLAGRLDPDAGGFELAPGTRVGYLPQEVSFERAGRSASEAYAAAVGSELAERLPLDATGLLAPRDVARPVAALSVGQRRRLALAALLADPPELLLLDEPTNHLSLSLVEELEAALAGFDGAVVLATHDRWLRSRWEGGTLALVPA